MTLTSLTLLLLFSLALILEIIDSSLGMMYGTILSPLLISTGMEPACVIPAILMSQGLGGITGTIAHQRCRNADFKGLTRDTKVVLAMVVPGSVAVLFGVYLGITLPADIVRTYISILVIVMSLLCMSRLRFDFSWWKHYLLGIVAAFNKALSGGGFGPVTSTGGIIGGLDPKESVATTTFSEVFICLAGFLIYLLFTDAMDLGLIVVLSCGAVMGGVLGPMIASRLKGRKVRYMVGALGLISGIWLVYRTLLG